MSGKPGTWGPPDAGNKTQDPAQPRNVAASSRVGVPETEMCQ